jgi:hypothetical protein
MSETDEALVGLDRRIDQIGESLSHLEMRLQSVLKSETMEKGALVSASTEKTLDTRSQLTQRLSGFAARAERHLDQVNRLIDRLSL